jgi:hypothetical protein
MSNELSFFAPLGAGVNEETQFILFNNPNIRHKNDQSMGLINSKCIRNL